MGKWRHSQKQLRKLRRLKKEVWCRARGKKMEEEHVVKRKIGDNGANIENIQRKVLWDEAAAMFRVHYQKK